jgi:hypothetical protein
VPTQRIELRWPAADAVPPVEALEVRVYPATAGWFGVVRDEVLATPAISADGHTLTYLNEQPKDPAKGKAIFQPTDMVAVFFDPAKAPAGATYGCPSIHLYPPSRTWSVLDLEIEWGCTEDSEQAVFDGRIETRQHLSFQAAPMLYAADLVGAHETTAKRFDYWLNCPGTVKPDGDFVDDDGSFEYGKAMQYDIGWHHDGTHTGTWLILRTMCDRCLLTGDTARIVAPCR